MGSNCGGDLDGDLIVDGCDRCPNLPNEGYGDVDCTDVVDVDDILYVLAGFVDPPNWPNADIAPCEPDGLVDVDDILAILATFVGEPPCP